MKHRHSCPKCSGSGLVRDDEGIDDICTECNGRGFITFTSKEKVFESSFMKILFFSVLFLIVFYSLFVISLTIFRFNFTVEIIVLFIGHAALATILISYLMLKSLSDGRSTG